MFSKTWGHVKTLKHSLDLDPFAWSIHPVTRLTAAAWMMENKSTKTDPEVIEKLQQ